MGSEIPAQLSRALAVMSSHLPASLRSVHWYGSGLEGGLKPLSDLDLLVTVDRRISDEVRRALSAALLEISAPPGESEVLRALEVTIVVESDVIPWRYPARREYQFGEWLRGAISAGEFEPALIDPDLAILLTKVRQRSLTLLGTGAVDLFEPVPKRDLFTALHDTLKIWNSPDDWAGDERNVILTLARIWYSAATGRIAAKDAAAEWAVARLPISHQAVLIEARKAYLGSGEECWSQRSDEVGAFVHFVKRETQQMLRPLRLEEREPDAEDH